LAFLIKGNEMEAIYLFAAVIALLVLVCVYRGWKLWSLMKGQPDRETEFYAQYDPARHLRDEEA